MKFVFCSYFDKILYLLYNSQICNSLKTPFTQPYINHAHYNKYLLSVKLF